MRNRYINVDFFFGIPNLLSLNIDLSEKNPLEILPDTATVVDLLKVFSLGLHRGDHLPPCIIQGCC